MQWGENKQKKKKSLNFAESKYTAKQMHPGQFWDIEFFC